MARPDITYVSGEVRDSIAVKQRILESQPLLQQITRIGHLLIDAYENGNKILIAGNGGSAADAQHIAAEFVSRFNFDRPGLPALALTTDTSIITAIGNDYGYDKLFRRQIEANGCPGDVFLGISTSGNSPNILEALEAASLKSITTIGLTGSSGGKMLDQCDECICVPSPDTPRIQEAHILIGHTLCAMVELALFTPPAT